MFMVANNCSIVLHVDLARYQQRVVLSSQAPGPVCTDFINQRSLFVPHAHVLEANPRYG